MQRVLKHRSIRRPSMSRSMRNPRGVRRDITLPTARSRGMQGPGGRAGPGFPGTAPAARLGAATSAATAAMPSETRHPLPVPVAVLFGFVCQFGQNGRFGSETATTWWCASGRGRDVPVITRDELFVRILGARGRQRNERDRENDRNCAEHSSLPCLGAATPR